MRCQFFLFFINHNLRESRKNAESEIKMKCCCHEK